MRASRHRGLSPAHLLTADPARVRVGVDAWCRDIINKAIDMLLVMEVIDDAEMSNLKNDADVTARVTSSEARRERTMARILAAP